MPMLYVELLVTMHVVQGRSKTGVTVEVIGSQTNYTFKGGTNKEGKLLELY